MPGCAGRSVYGSRFLAARPFRVNAEEGAAAAEHPRELVEAREVQRRSRPIAKDGRVHREKAHREVHEQAERMVVEEIGPNREHEPMRHSAPDQVRGHDVEVEEAPMIRRADVALRRIQLGKPLEPVHVEQVLRDDGDPLGPDVALTEPHRPVERAGLERATNGVDGDSLGLREPLASLFDQIGASGTVFGTRCDAPAGLSLERGCPDYDAASESIAMRRSSVTSRAGRIVEEDVDVARRRQQAVERTRPGARRPPPRSFVASARVTFSVRCGSRSRSGLNVRDSAYPRRRLSGRDPEHSLDGGDDLLGRRSVHFRDETLFVVAERNLADVSDERKRSTLRDAGDFVPVQDELGVVEGIHEEPVDRARRRRRRARARGRPGRGAPRIRAGRRRWSTRFDPSRARAARLG